MMPHRTSGWMVALIVLCGSPYLGKHTKGYVFAQDQPPPPPDQEQIEVLTRGPVHEAFAEPVNLQAQAGLVAPHRPPADIEEIPPTERPKDDRFAWIPGYWSWDTDRSDFIWVSACWRMAPPNIYWVPGYWTQVTDGWEWVAGFWAPTGTREIEYLPTPPDPLDLEPPGPSPNADTMWVPGCWYWDQGHYVRRPGYWLRQQPGWTWAPSHYRWTPRGYVFDQGHWDYALERRGVLFAPVYFPRSVYTRSGYTYSPSIALDLGLLTANLFIYPHYSHYYFGDYYDDVYLHRGIYPRYKRDRIHTWYDPIYTYDRWHHGRTDPHWEEHQRQDYDHRRSDKNLRPAHTYREMETRTAKMPQAQRRDFELAQPLHTIVERKASPLKFKQIKSEARQKIAQQATDVHKFREDRVKWETTKTMDAKVVRPPAEHKGPATSPREHKEPAPSPVEHKGPVTTPREHKEPVTSPVEHKGPVKASGENPSRSAPREVHITKPERVKVPAPPIVGKSKSWISTEKGPPPRPTDEQKPKAKVKEPRKNEGKKNKH